MDEELKDRNNVSMPVIGTGRILYNVTIKVVPQIAHEWLKWMLDEHIPQVMNTNCFIDYRVLRLLEADESEGPTYAIQYYANTQADYLSYIEIHAPEMRRRGNDKWGDQFIAFRSVLKLVKQNKKA